MTFDKDQLRTILIKWDATIKSAIASQEKVGGVFGWENDIIECVDGLMEEYTKSIEQLVGAADGLLLEYQWPMYAHDNTIDDLVDLILSVN